MLNSAENDMQRSIGYTLIELMVALAIVSVLAALAFPTLQQYVVKGKRTQAQAALMQLMQQQERYYTRTGSYLAFSAQLPAAPPFVWWSGANAAHSAYELRAERCPELALNQCVLLTALPGTEQVDSHFSDADCGLLTLDSAGQRRASGPAQRCWP
jgi:type IV pilus assembly protein PilE